MTNVCAAIVLAMLVVFCTPLVANESTDTNAAAADAYQCTAQRGI